MKEEKIESTKRKNTYLVAHRYASIGTEEDDNAT